MSTWFETLSPATTAAIWGGTLAGNYTVEVEPDGSIMVSYPIPIADELEISFVLGEISQTYPELLGRTVLEVSLVLVADAANTVSTPAIEYWNQPFAPPNNSLWQSVTFPHTLTLTETLTAPVILGDNVAILNPIYISYNPWNYDSPTLHLQSMMLQIEGEFGQQDTFWTDYYFTREVCE